MFKIIQIKTNYSYYIHFFHTTVCYKNFTCHTQQALREVSRIIDPVVETIEDDLDEIQQNDDVQDETESDTEVPTEVPNDTRETCSKYLQLQVASSCKESSPAPEENQLAKTIQTEAK